MAGHGLPAEVEMLEGSTALDPDAPWIRSITFLSPVYTVDRLYRSMMGPQATRGVLLHASAGETPELLWIVGYSAVVVGADGESPRSQEFMCHSNLDIDMPRHQELFGLSSKASVRLFTLSQGQQEIRFPEGFGIPVRSDEPLRLTTQVLNHNVEKISLELRHRVTVFYVVDEEAPAPMRALYQVAANGLVLVEGTDGYYNVPEADPELHGEGCLVGNSADPADRFYTDSQGRKFTGHWIVEPGVEVNRSNTTRFMGLRFDTKVHYIAVHLHPFAESLELRDLTAGESIFTSRVTPSEGKIGIDRIEHYADSFGLPLFMDHEYELVSTYNNSSSVDQDSMAVMYMYAEDMEFDRNEFLARRDSPAPLDPQALPASPALPPPLPAIRARPHGPAARSAPDPAALSRDPRSPGRDRKG
jgi:hypothetical protein